MQWFKQWRRRSREKAYDALLASILKERQALNAARVAAEVCHDAGHVTALDTRIRRVEDDWRAVMRSKREWLAGVPSSRW